MPPLAGYRRAPTGQARWNTRASLLDTVGRSKAGAKAALLMDGLRSQAAICKESGIDRGALSRLTKELRAKALLAPDDKHPKLIITILHVFRWPEGIIMEDLSTEILSTVREIRDLVQLIAEPAIAARDKKYRDELRKIVGNSKPKAKAVLLMNGNRAQAEIWIEKAECKRAT